MESLSFEDFLEWTKGQLQHYLMRRGKSTSGNKKDLAARALVAFESNDQIIDCSKDITDRLEREYSQLLFKLGIEDPLQLHETSWNQNLTSWPNINLGHIFHYILISKAFDTSYIGQYKARKAYSYLMSSHVHQVLTYYPPNLKDHVILKSSVTPSMKLSDKPWEQWILCSKYSGVVSAYCQCTAGFSNCCSHVIAVLYKVQFANDKGYTSPTCTEVPCAFNDRKNKKITPMKVKNMNLTKHDVLRPTPSHSLLSPEKENYDPRIPKLRQQSTQRIQAFFTKLEEVSPEAVVLLTVPPPESSDCPPPIPEIAESVRMECDDVNDEAKLLNNFMDKLTFSSKQLDELEKATKGQSSNRMWKKQRVGRITASNFHEVHTKVKSILASKGSTKPQTTTLLAKLTQIDFDSELEHVDAIKWGRDNEKKAREEFFRIVSVQHQQPKVSMCGLRAIESAPFLAASSDVIFSCSCCGKFCVELKCPYSARQSSISEGWERVDFLHKVDGNLKLKTTHKYYTQIQGQMKAYNMSKCFFVVWSPIGLPFIDVVDLDEGHWDEVYRNLLLFFKLYLAKVLLGVRVLRFCPICEKRILETNEIPPKKSLQENGIQCCSCCHWYHWLCVSVTTLPDSPWSCPTCCQTVDF